MLRKLFIAAAAFASLTANAQPAASYEALKSDITFLISNDNGRNGYYDQQFIADIMGHVAEDIEPEAVLALGDVFHYQGVQSVSDPLWLTNYEYIYTNPELMVDWLPVCGNHEYRGNTQAVLDYTGISRRWEMPAKYYSRSFEEDGTTIKVILIDTTPLIDKYREKTDKYPDAASQSAEEQLAWLDKELASATENWVVVAGHHPIYADTPKSKSERTDMQKRVDTILRKHRVDMYICGHIHNFQHIKPAGSNTDYVVNSSASLSRTNVNPIEGTVFVSGESGFSVLGASAGQLTLSMIDKEGNILHQVIRKK